MCPQRLGDLTGVHTTGLGVFVQGRAALGVTQHDALDTRVADVEVGPGGVEVVVDARHVPYRGGGNVLRQHVRRGVPLACARGTRGGTVRSVMTYPFETSVAGVKWHQDEIADVREGDEVLVRPEPENEYDRHARMVLV